jgi:hypothetical protein
MEIGSIRACLEDEDADAPPSAPRGFCPTLRIGMLWG